MKPTILPNKVVVDETAPVIITCGRVAVVGYVPKAQAQFAPY